MSNILSQSISVMEHTTRFDLDGDGMIENEVGFSPPFSQDL
jgi:hypothetical protein